MKRKKKIIIKVGNWYRIKFNLSVDGVDLGEYQGIGQCKSKPKFGIVSFNKLNPKLAGRFESGGCMVEDIVEELE